LQAPSTDGTRGREVVLTRDLRAALLRVNPQLPLAAIKEAIEKLTRYDFFARLLPGLSQLEAIRTRKCLKISKTVEKVSPTKRIF
jgi:hypothetical protein